MIWRNHYLAFYQYHEDVWIYQNVYGYLWEWEKGLYGCLGFEWKECSESPLQIIDQASCPITEEIVITNSELVRIELDDSLLKSFNQLSDDELILAFGSFTPVQSLNPYMTKLSLCSISQVRLFINIRQLIKIVYSNKNFLLKS